MIREIELPIHVIDAVQQFDYNTERCTGWVIEGIIDIDSILDIEISNRGIDSENHVAFVDGLRVTFHTDKIAQDQILQLAFPDKDKPIFMAKLKIVEK